MRKGVSTVISAVILTGVTIALGFVALAWTQGMCSTYVKTYGERIDVDIGGLSERLTVEYVFYNETRGEVRVYLLNCGAIDNVEVKTVSLERWVFADPSLTFLNGNKDQDLDMEEEVCIALSLPSPLKTGFYYKIRIETTRGVIFDSGFTA